MSEYGASTSAHAEPDLFMGYGNVPFQKTLPCVCGGLVTADIECPAAGVREHQKTARHRAWRRRMAWGLV